MSLDIHIKTETGSFQANCTNNLSPMWQLAGIHAALCHSSGKLCRDVLTDLRAGLERMRADPDAFDAINPANGWGERQEAVTFLAAVVAAFTDNPNSEIDIGL